MKFYITIFVFLLFILTGCSQETSSEKSPDSSSPQKQGELKENAKSSEAVIEMPLDEKKQVIMTFFQQDLGDVNKMEEEALQSITATSPDIIGNQTRLTELVNEKIPAYEATISYMKGLDPKIAELKPIKEKMVLAHESYFQALKLQQKAIETQDVSMFEKANKKMNQYLMIIEDYHYLVEGLSQKYQLDLSNG